jgi:hypothetical protein
MPKVVNKMTVNKRIADNKEQLIKQFKKMPIIQIACERNDISRSTFYRWCQEDSEFAKKARDALLDGKAMINDMAESQLISSIKDKSFQAIAYWLKHNHPDYRTRVELTPSAPQESLSAEQESKVLTAIQLLESSSDESVNG